MKTYYFEKNLQGDIVALYSANGTLLVTYSYTAWGQTFYTPNGAPTQAVNNPFRYRGYYYDKDLDIYYLNSRYYDQYVGRFISADAYVSTGQGFVGYNMYAYCNNNPVMLVDPHGTYAASISYNIYGSAIGGFSYGFGISFDDDDLGVEGGGENGAVENSLVVFI